MRSLLRLALLSCALTLAGLARADDAAIATLDAYARLPPPGATTAGVFMRLENRSAQNRALVSAASPAAERVELHTHLHEDGMMKMRAVPRIDVAARGRTELKPGGFHVMLIGLRAPLAAGATLPLTLRFEDGSEQSLSVPVRAAHGAMPPPESRH